MTAPWSAHYPSAVWREANDLLKLLWPTFEKSLNGAWCIGIGPADDTLAFCTADTYARSGRLTEPIKHGELPHPNGNAVLSSNELPNFGGAKVLLIIREITGHKVEGIGRLIGAITGAKGRVVGIGAMRREAGKDVVPAEVAGVPVYAVEEM